jgi:hypothetical protein
MKKQYFLQERRAAVKKFQTTIVFQALERTIRVRLSFKVASHAGLFLIQRSATAAPPF